MDLLAWWNLPFVASALLGLALALLASLGVDGADDAPEADAELDADVELGGDAELDAELEIDEADVDDVDGAGALLAFLGVGRAPLVVLLTLSSLAFGVMGLALSQLVAPWMPALFPVVFAGAASGSAGVTGVVARCVARIVPRVETYATSFDALAGCAGTIAACSSTMEGWVHVRDARGSFFEARCRSDGGQSLRAGLRVVIIDARSDERLCIVTPIEIDESAPWAETAPHQEET